MLDGIKKIHFVGIGGSGMSALAKIMLSLGYEVSGSDVNKSEITAKLEQAGGTIQIGHAAANIAGAEVVVLSSAIDPLNPEVIAAQSKGLKIIHRSDVLAALFVNRRGIAVAGAHGKTTTTSMIAHLLLTGGLDPTVVLGGEMEPIGGAVLGEGNFLVAEADESDGSFLKLLPQIAVITNIENDHLDHYGSMAAILAAFKEFVQTLPQDNGLAVVCFDNEYLREMMDGCGRRYISYALDHDAEYRAVNIRLEQTYTLYDVDHRGVKLGTVKLNVPGRHNIANSLAAIIVGLTAGLSMKEISASLASFKGPKRRFQTKGKIKGVWVVDDYAHHPTEIATTLLGAKQTAPNRLICVFQPHRYTRTKNLRHEFGSAFKSADLLILTDIYAAGEQPIAGIDGETIKEEVEKQTNQHVTYIPDKDKVARYLAEIVEPGDLVITMGAGNIFRSGEELTERLITKES
ncbi:MAG: UDP-N-acetylmuramate--L-alanine ligase [Sporomusaceae bacterium]|nr:UDP-N-acetylmuramate--L-alanine ligase [Sporomusaceae bacterium]